VVPGWTPTGEIQVYDSENLFDLVNGQAEVFFAYTYEQTTVQQYQDAAGTIITIEVWQTALPVDAYGLFSSYVAGSPSDIGNDSDADPGRRLAFWQDRYYVRVRARQDVDDADLRGLAQAVSDSLPSGGERPGLINLLPANGLVDERAAFFHEEISIQSRVWLGGENLLALGPETDGVLAVYSIYDTQALLLLVEYPGAIEASDAWAALESVEIAGLVSSGISSRVVAAVFGEASQAEADELIGMALASQ
jgi:hypothetical protein